MKEIAIITLKFKGGKKNYDYLLDNKSGVELITGSTLEAVSGATARGLTKVGLEIISIRKVSELPKWVTAKATIYKKDEVYLGHFDPSKLVVPEVKSPETPKPKGKPKVKKPPKKTEKLPYSEDEKLNGLIKEIEQIKAKKPEIKGDRLASESYQEYLTWYLELSQKMRELARYKLNIGGK